MASNGPDSSKGGLWGRLFGVQQEQSTNPAPQAAAVPASQPNAPEPVPTPAAEPAPPALSLEEPAVLAAAPPEPEPVAEATPLEPAVEKPAVLESPELVEPVEAVPEAGPAAVPVTAPAVPLAKPVAVAPPVAPPLAKPVAVAAPVAPPQPAAPVVVAPAPAAAVGGEICPGCGSKWVAGSSFCHDCGFMGAPTTAAAVAAAPVAHAPSLVSGMRIKSQYELVELLNERAGVARFRALDHGTGTPAPVMILRGEVPEMSAVLLDEAEPVVPLEEGDDYLPSFDEPAAAAPVAAVASTWPSVAWEQGLLENARHPALPTVIDTFVEDKYEYLVEEIPAGQNLWDVWTEANAATRYGWLKQVAEGLDALHKVGAIIEGIRPDIITVSNDGQAVITDLSDVLPLPVPADAPIKCTLYTAPELVLNPTTADARADLYSFGAMLYSLEYLGHHLEEKDFERQFTPKQITDRFPDVHPAFFRLINKTFVRDLNIRFPTDEAGRTDKTGFQELIRTLEILRRTLDNVRLDIAAWTTTGMVRTGNEDAFAFMHAVEQRQDDFWEYALVALADGMGGYEAGEVAAAICIQSVRKFLVEKPMFQALAGKEPPADETFSIDACKQLLLAALKHANKEVHTAARAPGSKRRGMGCTAEAVYVDNQHIVVSHVGDSRTYHLHQGRLIQLTRDQTLVNRLVELGKLTEEEAEDHPRKNELQQAIGGQPDVEPGLYHGELARGDWVLVCSDGLTNHIPAKDLTKMLMSEAAVSADIAARRLLNLVNLRGATDNATLVVIRAC